MPSGACSTRGAVYFKLCIAETTATKIFQSYLSTMWKYSGKKTFPVWQTTRNSCCEKYVNGRMWRATLRKKQTTIYVTADHHRTRLDLSVERTRRNVSCIPHCYAYDCCFMFRCLHLSIAFFQNRIIACFLFHHCVSVPIPPAVVSWCRGTVEKGRGFSFNLQHGVFSSP